MPARGGGRGFLRLCGTPVQAIAGSSTCQAMLVGPWVPSYLDIDRRRCAAAPCGLRRGGNCSAVRPGHLEAAGGGVRRALLCSARAPRTPRGWRLPVAGGRSPAFPRGVPSRSRRACGPSTWAPSPPRPMPRTGGAGGDPQGSHALAAPPTSGGPCRSPLAVVIWSAHCSGDGAEGFGEGWSVCAMRRRPRSCATVASRGRHVARRARQGQARGQGLEFKGVSADLQRGPHNSQGLRRGLVPRHRVRKPGVGLPRPANMAFLLFALGRPRVCREGRPRAAQGQAVGVRVAVARHPFEAHRGKPPPPRITTCSRPILVTACRAGGAPRSRCRRAAPDAGRRRPGPAPGLGEGRAGSASLFAAEAMGQVPSSRGVPPGPASTAPSPSRPGLGWAEPSNHKLPLGGPRGGGATAGWWSWGGGRFRVTVPDSGTAAETVEPFGSKAFLLNARAQDIPERRFPEPLNKGGDSRLSWVLTLGVESWLHLLRKSFDRGSRVGGRGGCGLWDCRRARRTRKAHQRLVPPKAASSQDYRAGCRSRGITAILLPAGHRRTCAAAPG